MNVSQSTSHSRLRDAAAVAAEEAYHFAGMALCACDLVLDTYYSVKPKRDISSVAISMALFIFHTLFLGRNRHSSVMPSKLVYLLDMLLHVGAFAMDAALVVSLLRYPTEDLGTETTRLRWRLFGNSTSIPVILVRIVYHTGILVTYYHWVQLRPPPTTAPYRASNCVSWLGETVRTGLQHRPVAPLVPPALLGDALERDRPVDAQQICLPSFELQHRPVSDAVTKRRPAAQANERREGTNERHPPTGARHVDQDA
ncbi:uncharacterized protein LOC119388726 [Rhipicephalus sanguineus]|uniref:uncharacterized protein LOC119388726 n=1 Tax=Rhipicephalus sanguineus TaxID=34632 RepID=UPI00189565A8|nr:uncharacterized protein LOC119388726 [Rhipicephalus sanguineus]